MERVNCPLCKVEVVLLNEVVEPVIAPHTPGPRAILDGRAVTHPHSNRCLGSHCTVPFAEGIAADRAAGLHLTAHP